MLFNCKFYCNLYNTTKFVLKVKNELQILICNDKFENIKKSINILIKKFDKLFYNYFFVNRNKYNNFYKTIDNYLNEIELFFVRKKLCEIYIDILELFFKLI